MRKEILKVLKEHFNDAMFCTREWSAWSYNNMTEDDFETVSEDFLDVVAEGIEKAINKSN